MLHIEILVIGYILFTYYNLVYVELSPRVNK